jgi:hypothetical protein
MKIHIRRMFGLLRGFLCPSRKRQTSGEFPPTQTHRDLGRQELEKFIYW